MSKVPSFYSMEGYLNTFKPICAQWFGDDVPMRETLAPNILSNYYFIVDMVEKYKSDSIMLTEEDKLIGRELIWLLMLGNRAEIATYVVSEVAIEGLDMPVDEIQMRIRQIYKAIFQTGQHESLLSEVLACSFTGSYNTILGIHLTECHGLVFEQASRHYTLEGRLSSYSIYDISAPDIYGQVVRPEILKAVMHYTGKQDVDKDDYVFHGLKNMINHGFNPYSHIFTGYK